MYMHQYNQLQLMVQARGIDAEKTEVAIGCQE